jgi:hypothetical protein
VYYNSHWVNKKRNDTQHDQQKTAVANFIAWFVTKNSHVSGCFFSFRFRYPRITLVSQADGYICAYQSFFPALAMPSYLALLECHRRKGMPREGSVITAKAAQSSMCAENCFS